MDMAAAASHVVELTVISGEELHLRRRRRVKKNTYVIVRTDACNAQQTRMDKDGGSYPSWNEKLVVSLPMHARCVTVEVRCKTHSGDKIVGAASVPTSDFLGGYIPQGHLQFLSYRLRDRYGERNGIVNLSVRVKTRADGALNAGCSRPWPAVPVGHDKDCNGIAIGVPVVLRY